MGKILVTGASGFIGGRLLPRLVAAGHALNVAGRRATATTGPDVSQFSIGDIGPRTDWRDALQGCDTVIHLAAQVPGRETADSVYDDVNAGGTGIGACWEVLRKVNMI